MINPNLYTYQIKNEFYALHRFKSDGEIFVCQQHSSGEWFTLRPARTDDMTFFVNFGNRVEPPSKSVMTTPPVMTEPEVGQ